MSNSKASHGAGSVDDATTVSLWLDRSDTAHATRPPLAGDTTADIAIVGAGFSGLWTAYYLSQLRPSARIVVVERHHVGFGPSGRNGGWCEGALAGPFSKYASLSSADAAMRLSRAMIDAVDEVARVATAEGFDCDYAKGGALYTARTGPQASRLRSEVEEMHELGFTDDDVSWLSDSEAKAKLNASGVRGAMWLRACAALDPAKLVAGLVDAVERRGVVIHEQTTATAVEDGRVLTDKGVVSAPVVVQATEAYTRDLKGQKRDLLPVYSLMIATEPLPDDVIDDIGLSDRPTFNDGRYMVIYGQRTADNRIAFGGRGVPYLFGSRISADNETHLASHRRMYGTLVDLLPQLDGVKITHRWGGVLAMPRNWLPGLRFDSSTGRGVLGGYVGEGVAAANLAGRTMAELIVGAETERVTLPWVGVSSRRWEPEPFRFMGVRSSRWLLGRADGFEERTDRQANLALRFARFLRGE